MKNNTEGENKNSQKLVQMRFFNETIEKIDELKAIRNARNKTQVVAEAISVFHIICKATKEGAAIVLAYPNGIKEKIILP